MTHQVMVLMTNEVHDEAMTEFTAPSPQARLRFVLRINATTSGLGGLVAAIAPGRLDDILGTGQPGWVRLIGIGLVAFAALVVVASRLDRDELVRATPVISLGDASWVIASIVAIALGWFSASGAVVMGLVGVMVGVFGVEQSLLVRQLSARRSAAVS